MSSPFSSDPAGIRDDTRRMVERFGDLARAQTDAGELQQLCCAQMRRSGENAEATVRACVSAREQRVTARRLYSTIDDRTAQPHETAACRTAAVLVVDDAADTRELVAVLRPEAGFAVRTAVNGLEGLLTAYEIRPDVIVMDRTMPVLDGIEATRLLKSTEAPRQSRVIAYTWTQLDPAPARAVVRRCRVKAVAAGHRPRGCSERSQSVATAQAV
jgi:CheY-like chemotaxis protein